MTENELVQLSANWVRQNSPRVKGQHVEILPSTPLFQSGLIDSLGLVNLIAFLEATTGSQIDLLELNEQELSTLEGLCRAATRARPE